MQCQRAPGSSESSGESGQALGLQLERAAPWGGLSQRQVLLNVPSSASGLPRLGATKGPWYLDPAIIAVLSLWADGQLAAGLPGQLRHCVHKTHVVLHTVDTPGESGSGWGQA